MWRQAGVLTYVPFTYHFNRCICQSSSIRTLHGVSGIARSLTWRHRQQLQKQEQEQQKQHTYTHVRKRAALVLLSCCCRVFWQVHSRQLAPTLDMQTARLLARHAVYTLAIRPRQPARHAVYTGSQLRPQSAKGATEVACVYIRTLACSAIPGVTSHLLLLLLQSTLPATLSTHCTHELNLRCPFLNLVASEQVFAAPERRASIPLHTIRTYRTHFDIRTCTHEIRTYVCEHRPRASEPT